MQFRWLIKFLVSLLMVSCIESSLDNKGTNSVGQNMCDLFHDKSYHQTTNDWELSNIIINKSTFEDIKELYGKPITERNFSINSNKSGCVYQYKFKNEHVIFYFLDSSDIVCGINILPSLILDNRKNLFTLRDLIKKYGTPELVGYDSVFGPNHRTVVWLEKGVQASVYLENNQKGSFSSVEPESTVAITLGYFHPTIQKNYNDTCLSSWYSEKPSESDVFDVYPKNPFHWK